MSRQPHLAGLGEGVALIRDSGQHQKILLLSSFRPYQGTGIGLSACFFLVSMAVYPLPSSLSKFSFCRALVALTFATFISSRRHYSHLFSLSVYIILTLWLFYSPEYLALKLAHIYLELPVQFRILASPSLPSDLMSSITWITAGTRTDRVRYFRTSTTQPKRFSAGASLNCR